MGVVVHLEPLEHIGTRPYREVTLMDARYFSKLIVHNYISLYKHVLGLHKHLEIRKIPLQLLKIRFHVQFHAIEWHPLHMKNNLEKL